MKSKRIRIEGPDGKLLEELDEETSRMVMALAKKEGISPQAAIRRVMRKGFAELLAKRNKVN